jgi:hypothetical protein
MITTPKPRPRKAIRLFRRFSTGHGEARYNAAFTTQQPQRSSAIHRLTQHKSPPHLHRNAISPLARPRGIAPAAARVTPKSP